MAVSFVSMGSPSATGNALTLLQPTATEVGDLLIAVVSTANQDSTVPSGWAHVSGSPWSQGTAASAGGLRLNVLWRIASTAGQSSWGFGDSGSYNAGNIMVYRGVDPTTPIAAVSSITAVTSATSNLTTLAASTSVAGGAFLFAFATDLDGNTTPSFSGTTLSGLVGYNFSTRSAISTNSGVGGGFIFADATAASGSAGSLRISASTLNVSTQYLGVTIAVHPEVDTTAPTITSSNAIGVASGAQLAHTLTANESVTWTITGGADAAQFEISGSTLRWSSNGTRDFYSPADSGANNVYDVQVTATDPSSNASNQSIGVYIVEPPARHAPRSSFIY